MQGAWVDSWTGELRSHMPWGAAKKKKKIHTASVKLMIYYAFYWLSLSISHGPSGHDFSVSSSLFQSLCTNQYPEYKMTNKTKPTIKTNLGFEFNTSHQKSVSTYQEIEFIPFLLLQMSSALHANNNFISYIKTMSAWKTAGLWDVIIPLTSFQPIRKNTNR